MGAAGGGPPLNITSRTYSASSLSPATCSVTYSLANDGDLDVTFTGSGSGTPDADEWWGPNPVTSIGDNWEVYYETVSGTPNTGTTDTWLALTTNRLVAVTGVPGGKTYQFKVQFRPAGGSSAIFTSGTVTITAERAV